MKEDEYKKSMLTLRMTMPAAGTLAAKRSEMPSSGWMWRVRAFGSTSRIAWRPNVRGGGRLNCTRIVVERFGIRLPARRKKGTPAHRQLSIASFNAAYVSVRECELTDFSCR